MYFATKIAALATFAMTLVSANTVTFVNQDATTRTIIFTPSVGNQPIATITVPGNGKIVQDFPAVWIGNWYSVSAGQPNIPGMLGEVTFGGWNGITYFDVSAIVNPNDHNGVKQMYPASQASAAAKTLVSGCTVFPCNTAYYLPDDVQTVTTKETDLICTLGGGAATYKRDEEGLVARKFVLGQS